VTLLNKVAQVGAVLKRRAEDRRELAEQNAAANTIQRYFRGFRARKKLRKLREDAAQAAKLQVEREAAEMQAQACQIILAFLDLMVMRTADRSASAVKGLGKSLPPIYGIICYHQECVVEGYHGEQYKPPKTGADELLSNPFS